MNESRKIAAIVAVLLTATWHMGAQTSAVSPKTLQRNTDGRILQPQSPSSPAVNAAVQPRTDRVERTLPPEIKEKVRQFEKAREAFINREENLRRQLDGAATDRDRNSIRQHIKENLDQWREQARQFRDEARERARELQRDLPNHREALEETPRGTPGRPGRPGLD
ncbi:MAG TPA: hypothetical protein VNT99_10915 [Methylomirabilota bacterium]|nr:hypothetical protein [Methylomirabilota bacterium]